jgi:hypothetical protein
MPVGERAGVRVLPKTDADAVGEHCVKPLQRNKTRDATQPARPSHWTFVARQAQICTAPAEALADGRK